MMSKKAKVKAIIFDMDGVLFLSSKAHARAYAQILRKLGVNSFNYSVIAGMNTRDSIEKLNKLFSLNLSNKEKVQIHKEKSALAFRLLSRKPLFANKMKNVVSKLSKSYPLALVSSGSRKNVNLFLRKSKLRSKFQFSISGDEVPQAKPNPLIYKRALKRLKIKPSNGLVLEDSKAGVLAAKRARIPVIGITGTLTSQKLRQLGVIRVIRQLTSLNRYV